MPMKTVGLFSVPGNIQTEVFSAADFLEPTIISSLWGGCHWFTPEMYQDLSGAPLWKTREETCLHNPPMGLFQVRKVEKLEKKKKKNPAWNDVSDELSREKHAEGLVCKTKTSGEKGSFLHLWRKKRPFRMKTRSPTFDKRVCAGMNASVWRVIKLSWSIHHAVTVWMKPVKGQAVSRLLLPHKRRENKLSWEVTRQIRCNSHIRSLPPTCPCILHWAVKLKKKKNEKKKKNKRRRRSLCLTAWKTQRQNVSFRVFLLHNQSGSC